MDAEARRRRGSNEILCASRFGERRGIAEDGLSALFATRAHKTIFPCRGGH
jgi:hypothetical protein